MAAFEKIKSGIPEMDEAFHHIRLGDNVVWQVSDLSEFRLFMEPMVEQAIKDGRNLIYVRFAAHEPLLTPREVFIEALKYGAVSIILLHNHPSGDPAPSKEDLLLTRRMREAGSILNIPVIDHDIIGDNKYCSFKESGYL